MLGVGRVGKSSSSSRVEFVIKIFRVSSRVELQMSSFESKSEILFLLNKFLQTSNLAS